MANQSFMKSLFHGVIAESVVFPYPTPSEGECDSINAILESVRRFCAANVDSAKIDQAHEIPDGVMDGLKALGLFGMQIPTEHGGIGLSTTGYARVIQEIAGTLRFAPDGSCLRSRLRASENRELGSGE